MHTIRCRPQDLYDLLACSVKENPEAGRPAFATVGVLPDGRAQSSCAAPARARRFPAGGPAAGARVVQGRLGHGTSLRGSRAARVRSLPPFVNLTSEPDHWMIALRRNPSSRGRRAGGGLFLLLFGGVFLYFLVPEIVANVAAARWTPSSCTILSSGVSRDDVRDDGRERTLYRLDVTYSYETEAGRQQSTRYRFIDPFTDNRVAAESTAARYSPGAVVPCHVDPGNPTQAVLDRRLSPFMLIVLLPGAIADLGVWNLADVCAELWRGFFRTP